MKGESEKKMEESQNCPSKNGMTAADSWTLSMKQRKDVKRKQKKILQYDQNEMKRR